MNADDKLEQCPYNKAHSIVRSRMPSHLMKCIKHYQGEKMTTCPFNAMHKFLERERKEHFQHCDDYQLMLLTEMEMQDKLTAAGDQVTNDQGLAGM